MEQKKQSKRGIGGLMMARLVDAEKVYELGHRTPFHIGIADLCDLKELLADVPTVDAVSVVRCRECEIHGYCATEDVFSFAGISNPFCCAGKRKEGDRNE